MKKQAKVPVRSRGIAAHAGPNPRPFPWATTVFATLFAIVLFVGTSVALAYDNLSDRLGESVVNTDNLGAVKTKENEEKPPADAFNGRPVNILIAGIDARSGQDASIVNPDDDDPTMRSDTTMILHLSADRQHAYMVSLPRDMLADIPECRLTDGSTSPAQFAQFNWAFSFGASAANPDDLKESVAGGIACTQATVEEMTGLVMDGFVVIDFTGFEGVIDSLGGVDLCTDEDVDSDMTGFQLEAGCHHLNPSQALAYARERYGYDDGSDMSRIGRQQQLLGAVVKEILETNMLTDLPKLYAFMQEALATMFVSPSLSSPQADVGLALSLKNTPPDQIRFVIMPVLQLDTDQNRLIPKEPGATELWDALRNDAPLPPGTVYRDMDNQLFTIDADGNSQSGGEQRTDAEVGSLDGWY